MGNRRRLDRYSYWPGDESPYLAEGMASIVEAAMKQPLELIADFKVLGPCLGQLLDAFKQGKTEWRQWDEAIRNRLSELMQACEKYPGTPGVPHPDFENRG